MKDKDGNYRYDLIVEKFYLPINYTPTEKDKNIEEYTYQDVENLNKKLNKDIQTSENDQT